MIFSQAIENLINSLIQLPGVGKKSATRMALTLLQTKQTAGEAIANSILQAIDTVQNCQQCNILTENPLCNICQSQKRNHEIICVVESSTDVIAIEQTSNFNGVYFVLQGHLSPIDGIGPDELSIPKLQQRITDNNIKEIILATNSTIEGETTAHYIATMAQQYNIHTTRIAHGIPIGSELEYIDQNTIVQAFNNRATLA